ncbi:hypothetical protein Hanom_Chr09g00764381 [Helianthus anomalus]
MTFGILDWVGVIRGDVVWVVSGLLGWDNTLWLVIICVTTIWVFLLIFCCCYCSVGCILASVLHFCDYGPRGDHMFPVEWSFMSSCSS